MAQRTVVTVTDDIDGSEASETVVFSLDGSSYEIDLNEAHAEDLREVLAPYVGAARRTAGTTGRPGRRGATASIGSGAVVDATAVRAWAEANGVPVSPRGRIKADVVEQYRSATA